MLEFEQARDALRCWALRVGRVVELQAAPYAPAGQEITAFAVTTECGEQFILKNIAGKLNAKRIETEYSLLRHLHALGVPVAVPVLSDSEQPAFEDQDRIYLLYPMLPVDHTIPPEGVELTYANIGAAVARLHKALAVYPGHIDSWTMNLPHTVFEEAIPRILLNLTGQDAEAARRVVAALKDEMTPALQDLPVQTIHGDCHGGNYLLYRGDVSGFVDLDHLPTGPRVYDIGYLLTDMAKAQFFSNHAHRHWLKHFHHVIAGYQRENRLLRREKDALWFVMLATQLLFVDWFFKYNRDDLARKNLEAFYWVYERGDDIIHRISFL